MGERVHLASSVDHAGFNAVTGRLVAHARRDAGLTQEALAEVAGLTRGSIANIEMGRQALTVHSLTSIARHLQVPIERLLPSRVHESEASDTGTPAASEVNHTIYRVGQSYGLHVYRGDRPVATFHDGGEAARFVAAMNASEVERPAGEPDDWQYGYHYGIAANDDEVARVIDEYAQARVAAVARAEAAERALADITIIAAAAAEFTDGRADRRQFERVVHIAALGGHTTDEQQT